MPSGPPPTAQRYRVKELYDKGLSAREMAAVLGVSTQAIHYMLKKLEVPPPSRKGQARQ